jgi:hypothetical protein
VVASFALHIRDYTVDTRSGLPPVNDGGFVFSSPFTKIMATLDDEIGQDVHDDTHDEMTHFTFLSGYLKSRGAEPVNLEAFRKLPSSTATGARRIGRLTNLIMPHPTTFLRSNLPARPTPPRVTVGAADESSVSLTAARRLPVLRRAPVPGRAVAPRSDR